MLAGQVVRVGHKRRVVNLPAEDPIPVCWPARRLRGLVTRAAHPSDRRQVLVSLTPAAHELIAADRRRREAWLVAHLTDLDGDERELLREAVPLLERLAAAR